MEEMRSLQKQEDFLTVYGKADIHSTFKNGMEVPVKIK